MAGVSRKEIARDLRRLGLRAGDVIELHSSLKSIGYVQGGAKTVVRAFQEVLGEKGTLLTPTFTGSFEPRGKAFHPDETPSTSGLVTETFRKMPGVVRSICPIHSVAAWGRRAREFTERHPLTSTLGAGSPFHLASQAGGKVVLLGCDHNSNSFLHVVESLAGHPMIFEVAPYGARGLLKRDDGRIKEIALTEFTACSKSFRNIHPHLDREGLVRRGRVGAAPTQVMVGRELIDKLVPLLRRKPDLLLCPPGCRACDLRRANIEKHRSAADGERRERERAGGVRGEG